MVWCRMVSNGVEWCGVKWCQVSVMTLESLVTGHLSNEMSIIFFSIRLCIRYVSKLSTNFYSDYERR